METVNSLINAISDGPTSIFVAGQVATVSYIVTAAVGLLICFLGLKLLRVWNALWGVAIGALAGCAVSLALRLDTMVILIVTAVAALVMAVLSGIFVKFGAFWVCLVGMSGMMVSILRPGDWIMTAVCGAVGLIVAIVAMIWFEPALIAVTAIYGGFLVGNAASVIAANGNTIVAVVVAVIVAAFGIAVQFAMKSSEINKKEVRKAKAIKEEISKEAEIEQARTILDLDDEDEDEE